MKKLKTETKNLLAKEAALSCMNLGVGLTFLRKYDFALLGFIYQSFFSLSIGIERLIKLILLYEYILKKDAYPPFNYLKSKGHSLTELFNEVKGLSDKYSCNSYFNKLNEEPVYQTILDNLSDFATANRYFHLNKLSGNDKTEDPVSRWDKEVNSYIISKHFKSDTKKNQAAREFANNMSNISFVRHFDEHDNEINDYSHFMEASLQVEVKQKYGMYYTFCIIKALCHLQYEQYFALRSDIHLYEFFMIFRADYKRALNLKSWNPHPPYKF